ncbi:M48 family metalloprotease [Dongia rigui]|uniref:M48 family metalloprotease n=1 Tax=Dongia rigui TaxID=940149 RepID=A0ABU5E0W2_9PROT|nr:M48 family metalloprotease [Dongia rigui]MDY0873176.1 M48 family metalloprotease [Dongia rigui]
MINRANATQVCRRIGAQIGTLLLALSLALPAGPALAQQRALSLIRDAEIESTIRAYADPLFRAAGLDPLAIRVLLVNEDSINAFVAGGQRLFINTGLLLRADTPNQVKGVIAHETGHIAGAHLSRIQDELKNATIEQIIGMLLGAGAAVASGNGGAVIAGTTLGNEIAKRSLLQYSRTQEAAADQAGMGFLDATHQSSRGMAEFFEKLEEQEFLLPQNQDPYLLTHPLTTDRVSAVEQHVSESAYSDAKDPPEDIARHERMVAKLKGYIWPLQRVEQEFPKTDTSIGARYARAIALFRVSRMPEALQLMDSLLADIPNDPYFLEQKAQILFENGKLREALPLYTAAFNQLPTEPLLGLEVAQVEIELEEPELTKSAIRHLEAVTTIEPRNSRAWYFLSVAYGRDGNLPMSSLAQAEQAMAQGNSDEAWAQAKRALEGLPAGSPGWLKANDIISEAQMIKANK